MDLKKRVIPTLLLAAVCILPTAAADDQNAALAEDFSIYTGLDKAALDLSGLPVQPYRQGDEIMVPLARVSQALGYLVSWDPVTGDITVDDDYIQKVTLRHGSAEADFSGHLTVIDMSRQVELSAAANVIDGCTYVPLSLFCEFFNETSVDGSAVYVAPSMVELDGTQ